MRTPLALAVGLLAAWGSDLLHPSAFYSLFLPLLSVAAFLYVVLGLLLRLRGSGGGGSADGGSGGCGWGGDSCGDGGGDGGGGD